MKQSPHRPHFPDLHPIYIRTPRFFPPIPPHQFSSGFFSPSKYTFSLSLFLLRSYFSFSFFLARQELANPQETLEETDSGNQRVVRALYEALNARDVEKVHSLLSPDLDWWFHGPPSHQFLMRLLTGAKPDDDQTASPPFRFDPQSFASFGPTVIVEGCDYDRSIAWVHAWTVTDGIITQVREYLNTSLTVTRLGNSPKSSPSSYSSSSSSSTAEIASYHCPSVWESSLSDRVGKSVPGLVLAI